MLLAWRYRKYLDYIEKSRVSTSNSVVSTVARASRRSPTGHPQVPLNRQLSGLTAHISFGVSNLLAFWVRLGSFFIYFLLFSITYWVCLLIKHPFYLSLSLYVRHVPLVGAYWPRRLCESHVSAAPFEPTLRSFSAWPLVPRLRHGGAEFLCPLNGSFSHSALPAGAIL